MRFRFAIYAVLLLAFPAGCADEEVGVQDSEGVVVADPLDCDADDVHRYACCVFDEVNLWRKEQDDGLAPYLHDGELSMVAYDYSAFMAERGDFGHGLDNRGIGERLNDYGIFWRSVGENIQRNSFPDWHEACVSTVRGSGGWAGSDEGHREAMLGTSVSGEDMGWTQAGVGVARGDRYWYVTMYFLRDD